jgi:hypothetical protein
MVRGLLKTIELTMEKERKEKEKEFKKNFDLVKLESSSWTIDVPVRKKQMITDEKTLVAELMDNHVITWWHCSKI